VAPAGPEDITDMLALADAVAGKKLFKKCGACHTYAKGGPNKQGPNLWNVVGGDRGAAAGFKYSRDMKSMGGKWKIEDLNTFLYKPKMLVKKTKMNFAGFKKAKDRANIIVFLQSKADAPIPMTK
jgi:cytochrome c